MAMMLNSGNITLVDYRENEVALAINVMEEHLYCMSPQLALELALLLENKAREVIAQQNNALANFEKRKPR
jgi:uncharacterized protein with PIN domain